MNGDGFVVTVFAQGDHENTPAEAIHHGLAHAHEAGFITAWSDLSPASVCRARLDAAEKALAPLAAAAVELGRTWQDHETHWHVAVSVTVGQLRAAVAALAAIREGRE